MATGGLRSWATGQNRSRKHAHSLCDRRAAREQVLGSIQGRLLPINEFSGTQLDPVHSAGFIWNLASPESAGCIWNWHRLNQLALLELSIARVCRIHLELASPESAGFIWNLASPESAGFIWNLASPESAGFIWNWHRPSLQDSSGTWHRLNQLALSGT